MPKEVATGLRLDKELADEIDKLAKADHRPRTQFITHLLREKIEQLKADKAS